MLRTGALAMTALLLATMPTAAFANTQTMQPVTDSATQLDLSDAFFEKLATSYPYMGKAVKPSYSVMCEVVNEQDNGDGTATRTTYLQILDRGIDYTARLSGNTQIGTARLTISGKGNWTGTASATFKVTPAKTSVRSLRTSKSKLRVACKKVAGGCSYRVSYRMKGAKRWQTAPGSSFTRTIGNVKRGKTYSVRAQAYKKVGGKIYRGAWSKVRSIKIA